MFYSGAGVPNDGGRIVVTRTAEHNPKGEITTMKKIFFTGLASGLFLLLLAGNLQAYIIVDTREPTILNTAVSLEEHQWIATQFSYYHKIQLALAI